MPITKTQLAGIRYFWEYKGDVERFIEWDDLLPMLEREQPALYKAWRDYKVARQIFDAVVMRLPDYDEANDEGQN